MYNNEMKEGFIKDYMRSRVVAKTSLYGLFRKIATYERTFNKDCSQFTKEEILKMYKEFKSKSVYVLLNNTTILKAYCAWLKYYHGFTGEVAYEELTTEILKPLIPEEANKVLSREEVIEIEDQLYNWTDKAIVEALFEGLSGNSMRDLIGIKANMIDHNTKQLILSDGRVFDLTDRLYEFLVNAFDETEYICYGQSIRIKKLFGSGRLYKERDNTYAMDSDDKFFRWVYRKVMNFRDHVGIPGLTMKNLQTAGMCYYLKKGMEETGLELKPFLQTDTGEELMQKYNYFSEFRIDNIVHRYSQLI